MELGRRETIGLRELFHGPARYVPTSPWGPFGALFVTLVACVASIAFLFAAAAIATAIGTTDIDLARAGHAMANLGSPVGLTVVAASQIVSLGVIWLAAGRNGMRGQVLRLLPPKPGWGSAIAAGLIIVFATGALELLLYYGVGFDPFADSKWLLEGLRSPLWWGTVFVAVVLAPLWEEIAFRGFLLSALAQTRDGFWLSAIVTSALWTALHAGYSYPGLASVFTAGLVLSWLMWRWGSLRGVVVAHSLANVAALLFTYNFAPTP